MEKGGRSCADLEALLRCPDGVDTNHVVVVDEAFGFETVFKMLKLAKRGFSVTEAPKEFNLVTSKWLSECLREYRVVDYRSYCVSGAPVGAPVGAPTGAGTSVGDGAVKRRHGGDTSIDASSPSKVIKSNPLSTSEGNSSQLETFQTALKEEGNTDRERGNDKTYVDDDSFSVATSSSTNDSTLPPGNWLCARASASGNGPRENPNGFVIEQLEKLCQVYKTTNDQWRRLGYQKAISGCTMHMYFMTTIGLDV